MRRRRPGRAAGALVLALALVPGLALPGPAAAVGARDGTRPSPWLSGHDLLLVSHDLEGRPARWNERPSVSADGRLVAYRGATDQLPGAPGGPDPAVQVLVRDLDTDAVVVASASAGGELLDAPGYLLHPVISADGRYVVFSTGATNLVPPGTPHGSLYRKDLRTGAVAVVDRGLGGADADDLGFDPVMTRDGRLVVYASHATNLVEGDTNGRPDVFVTDVRRGVTTRLGVDAAGAQLAHGAVHPSVSADGRRVAFVTTDPLVARDRDGTSDAYVRDVRSGRVRLVGPATTAQLTPDGRAVAFGTDRAVVADDTNGVHDVYVRSLVDGSVERVSVAQDGTQGTLASLDFAVSYDGRYVAFSSAADTLVPGDTNATWDVVVRDRRLGRNTRVTVSPTGVQADPFSSSGEVAISWSGRTVAFQSDAENLVDSTAEPGAGRPNIFAARAHG